MFSVVTDLVLNCMQRLLTDKSPLASKGLNTSQKHSFYLIFFTETFLLNTHNMRIDGSSKGSGETVPIRIFLILCCSSKFMALTISSHKSIKAKKKNEPNIVNIFLSIRSK